MREFSRRAGSNPALVSRVIRGLRHPPLASLDRWADAFSLSGSERSDFIEQGRLAVCPPEIAALVRRLRRENVDLKAKHG
ncbi:MAG: hypothetical protein H0W83_00130 [Planctomycetes bacterium]|nr:hypothetical protein [Planctomycetota bacterium]